MLQKLEIKPRSCDIYQSISIILSKQFQTFLRVYFSEIVMTSLDDLISKFHKKNKDK